MNLKNSSTSYSVLTITAEGYIIFDTDLGISYVTFKPCFRHAKNRYVITFIVEDVVRNERDLPFTGRLGMWRG